ncbi:hypothetical protein OAM99_02505 [Planktomarina sp.]|nr:hypothetical protein [Planktomarina sp.]
MQHEIAFCRAISGVWRVRGFGQIETHWSQNDLRPQQSCNWNPSFLWHCADQGFCTVMGCVPVQLLPSIFVPKSWRWINILGVLTGFTLKSRMLIVQQRSQSW